MSYVNISGYKFTELNNLQDLQHTLHTHCTALHLKGTILLSQEGINAFLCGTPEQINDFYGILPTLGLPTIDFKESPSTSHPFKHMRVKIKKEIITMGVPEVNPAKNPAPAVSPETFKAWLDEGKPMIILDTRNDYEVRIGKFKNAVDLDITHFGVFPEEVVNQLSKQDKKQVIVSYCTGGIRCEKAAPYLIDQGFENVYQLEGGILKYFEKCGNAHYEGDCFVFDQRIAVDSALAETHVELCTVCQATLCLCAKTAII